MLRSIGKQSGSPWSQSWRRKGTHCRDQLLHSSRSDDMQAEGRHKIAPNYHGMRSGPTSNTSFLESTRLDTSLPLPKRHVDRSRRFRRDHVCAQRTQTVTRVGKCRIYILATRPQK